MSVERTPRGGPWTWIPTLYVAEGLPYMLVTTVSVTMYKRFGLPNATVAFATSLLYLAWVVKPLWSPVVDLAGTRRGWIWGAQLVLGAGVAGAALAIPTSHMLTWTLACLWLLAFASATHDIAADGFYLLGASEAQQSAFVGVRSTFYRVAMILAQGPLVILAGLLETRSGSARSAWSVSLGALALVLIALSLWHRAVLPRPAADRAGEIRRVPEFLRAFLATFVAFFRKPRIGVLLTFLLVYRLGEAQLVKMVAPFLLDPRAKGGLALTTTQLGFVYGTMGVFALVVGGVLGGVVVARHGLKAWLWPMLFAIHLPDAAFIYLAYARPASLAVIQACVAVEQFGYGFGFTAYVMYMIHIARGEHPTAHYAVCTGFMALGMMVPGLWSGWLQERVGYPHFFVWVLVATVPSFLIALALPLEAGFGRAPRSNRT